MTKQTPLLIGTSEFDAFLYASIGLENDGAFLSVLSALARTDVDPWEEAARLAHLPRAAASRFLANLISAQPGDSVARGDPTMQAERLSALLPSRAPLSERGVGRPWRLIRHVIYYVVLVALFFGSHWIMQSLWGSKPSGAATVAPAQPALAPPGLRLAPSTTPNHD